jgi:DNA-binding XRE family transcriptional regulator
MGHVGDARSSFGELLRDHRRAAELTQEELAERAGVSVRTVSDLERGGCCPTAVLSPPTFRRAYCHSLGSPGWGEAALALIRRSGTLS